MGKGGGSAQTGVQKIEPADFVKPYLTQAAQESQRLYGQGSPEFFTGSTYVPFSPESEISLQAQTSRALQGSPLTQAAQQETLRTATGGYLTGSPQLQQELQAVKGMVNQNFARGGGYRSSANQEALTRDLSKAVIGNYNTERQLQQQAINNAPSMAAQDYADINQLAQVGTAREDLFGRQLQDQMDRFNFLQNADNDNLQNYIRNITALSNGYQTQTSTEPKAGSSVLGKLVGGAQAGLGLGTSLGYATGAGGAALSGTALASSLGPFAIGGALLGGLLS